jgi:hypothetical protein
MATYRPAALMDTVSDFHGTLIYASVPGASTTNRSLFERLVMGAK